uniref:Ig-like domain-containing protein n=1 Tax=Mesocestoides corti TaxID=53468 RepID=A0A5K3EG48_MESCO
MELSTFLSHKSAETGRDVMVNEVTLKIRNWINSTGQSLLNSHNSKPENFKEAINIRKQHEQLEFKCLTFLAEYASVGEFRTHSPSSDALLDLDLDILAFIDKLNFRTYFVVSCFTYFREHDELCNFLVEVEGVSKAVNLSDIRSVVKTIKCLDQALQTSNTKITILSRELELLKTIQGPEDVEYLSRLETKYEEVCSLTARAQQIMNLRKLLLLKEQRILECEEKINSSKISFDNLVAEVYLKFGNLFVGKSALEATQLAKTYQGYAEKLQVMHDDWKHLFDLYCRMCNVDHRITSRPIIATRTRLLGQYSKVREEVEKLRMLTEDSKAFYAANDSLLEAVSQGHFPVNGMRSTDAETKSLEKMSSDFQNLKKKATILISNAKEVSERLTAAYEEMKADIQLKIYTIYLQLREYERKLWGDVKNFFDCPDELIPPRCRNTSHAVSQQRPQLSQSLPQLGSSLGSIISEETPVISKPIVDGDNKVVSSEQRNTKRLDKFSRRLAGLTNTSPNRLRPSTLKEVENLLQNVEMAGRLADMEWRKLSSCLDSERDLDEAGCRYNAWQSGWLLKRDHLVNHKRILMSAAELQNTMDNCRQQLDLLVSIACNCNESENANKYIEELNRINKDVMSLRKRVPALESRLDGLNQEARVLFNSETPPCLLKLNEDWDNYQQVLGEIESLLARLIKGTNLLAAAHEFILVMKPKLDTDNRDPQFLTDVQQEATRLQERIERHLDSGSPNETFSLSTLPNRWLNEGLLSALGPLKEASEEAELMVTNLNDRSNTSHPEAIQEKTTSDGSSFLKQHQFSLAQRCQENEMVEYQLSEGQSSDNVLEPKEAGSMRSNHSPPSKAPDGVYMISQLEDISTTPGSSVGMRCAFSGFDTQPIVDWSFTPAFNIKSDAISLLATTSEVYSDMRTTWLAIPNILYKHAGNYSVTITHPQNGETLSSSAKIHVESKFKRGLSDVTAIVDGNKCTVTGKVVEFVLEYDGFDRIPSLVVWLHNGRPIDPTKWAVSVSPLATRIKSDCLKSVDEGQYTCRVADKELGVELESSATLRIKNSLDIPLPASRASSRAGTPSGSGGFPKITVALDGCPLALKCPLPSSAVQAYDRARRVRMRWFRDGTQLYDSDSRDPDYFKGAKGLQFLDGNTCWNAGITEKKEVLLCTNRVRSVDAGVYSCRVGIDDDVYESSGILTVCSGPQFVEQLVGTKVYLGEPAVLRCRVEPWLPGSTPEEEKETTITWYHFDTPLSPELQARVGIKTECDEGLCTLRIERASRRFAGLYKCESKSKFGICETSCRLLIDQPVRPTIMGPIQCLKDASNEDVAILRVEYDAVPQPEVMWLKDNQPLNPEPDIQITTSKDESQLRLLRPQAKNNGLYAVIIKNVAGSTETSQNFEFGGSAQLSDTPMPSPLHDDNLSLDLPSTGSSFDPGKSQGSHQPVAHDGDIQEVKSTTLPPLPAHREPTVNNCQYNTYPALSIQHSTSQTVTTRLVQEGGLVKRWSSETLSTCPEGVTKAKQCLDACGSFLLRPQSISANPGETVIFSCLIRPPPGTPKIHKVSWRHKNCDLSQHSSEMPRVVLKANDPCDGVFQLQLTNISEGDHGDYEVVALAADLTEICSATFNLSVDVFEPCKMNPKLCGSAKCRHKVRVTSTTTVNKPFALKRYSASLPDLYEMNSTNADLGMEFKYSLDRGTSKTSCAQQKQQCANDDIKPGMHTDSHAGRYYLTDSGRSKSCERNQSRDIATPPLIFRPSKRGFRKGAQYQSLPTLFDANITHTSTVLTEEFTVPPKMTSPSSWLSPGRSSFNAEIDEKNCRKGERKLSQRHSFFLGRPYLPSSATVSVGGRLEVNCYISGYPIPQVFWLKDGRQVKDSYPEDDLQLKRHGHVFQLIIPSARLHHAGLWEVVARNLAGLVISSSYIHVIDVSLSNSDRTTSETPRDLQNPLPPPSPCYQRQNRSQPSPSCSISSLSERRTQFYLNRSNDSCLPPQFTRLFYDKTAFCGEGVIFECTVIGVPTPTVHEVRTSMMLSWSTNVDEFVTVFRVAVYGRIILTHISLN